MSDSAVETKPILHKIWKSWLGDRSCNLLLMLRLESYGLRIKLIQLFMPLTCLCLQQFMRNGWPQWTGLNKSKQVQVWAIALFISSNYTKSSGFICKPELEAFSYSVTTIFTSRGYSAKDRCYKYSRLLLANGTIQPTWETGIPLLLAIELFAPKARAQIKTHNANPIHELYSENEFAAKKLYHNKNAIAFRRLEKVDNEHVIIEGKSELGHLFCKYSDQDLNKIHELREDSSVQVRGKSETYWAPFGMFLSMNDCRVI